MSNSELKGDEVIRMSFDIPVKLHNRLKLLIHWGSRSEFLRKIIESAVSQLEQAKPQYRDTIIGGIITGNIEIFRRKDGETTKGSD